MQNNIVFSLNGAWTLAYADNKTFTAQKPDFSTIAGVRAAGWKEADRERYRLLLTEAGMKNVLVSNGSASAEVLEEVLPYIDAMNIDLKTFDPDIYSGVLGNHAKSLNMNFRQCFAPKSKSKKSITNRL